ncbi:hypothetical protein CC99x_008430 [Candidatus Berkiella cookevillensis]|uniref:Uncharacterized protein n=1 Tax=Candidatus Berkiella cookevillensis TaxID=437022 RepID=A0A0Q9YFG0_9GAMM|nr:hypothetical protein [Candidatus Berkiella cookevillensis]MCS5708925.1 hypothetical protein [Candidatus Berkiella cookevillensis]
MSKFKFTFAKEAEPLRFLPTTAKNFKVIKKITKKIQSPKAGFIDEESLLPGAVEHTEFIGKLELSDHKTTKNHLEFKPLIFQKSLLKFNLRSQGIDLYYTLSHHNRELIATQGANGALVFKAVINDTGSYSFILFKPIDRERSLNLIVNENFNTSLFEMDGAVDLNNVSGWKLRRKALNNQSISELYQKIKTNINEMYQVTFYYRNNQIKETNTPPIDVYWNNEHLVRLDNTSTRAKGYTFSVLSNTEKFSQLRFVCADDASIKNLLSNISVLSRAQSNIPIVLAFALTNIEDMENILEGNFKINITATPSLELNNHLPIDIVLDEKNIYQTIVINDESISNNPFAKINLDSIFEMLNVEKDNRQVQIIQREQDGIPSNFYAIKVSSKDNDFSPITVADLQLSFPGGDAGTAVFFKNVAIDEV